MSWMDWIALKHDLFVHLPIAAAILVPFALVAAQRPGRGIKPWWTTCRYLAWGGVVGSLAAVVSGLGAAYSRSLLARGQILSRGAFDQPTPFQMHQWIAGGSLLLGLLTLRALHRRREEHQGIGILGLFLGSLWAGATLVGGYYGSQLSHPRAIEAMDVTPPKPIPPADPEASAPLRALDYLSLVPIHPEPVKSVPHGNRWIRVWVSPTAAEAYREGRVLPEGALVVMSSVEDRWGRPGFEPGPLYALEVKTDGRPHLTYYWARVPEARRNETQGRERAYWRGDDDGLKACLECHREGAAPLKDRSRWVVPRVKPRTEEDTTK